MGAHSRTLSRSGARELGSSGHAATEEEEDETQQKTGQGKAAETRVTKYRAGAGGSMYASAWRRRGERRRRENEVPGCTERGRDHIEVSREKFAASEAHTVQLRAAKYPR